jgi:hypothetical protein
MPLLKLLVNASAIIAAVLSGVFWIRAAYARVNASSEEVGVGWGGAPVNVRDHTGAVLDFLQTYALQSKWNSRAALTSGVAGILGAIVFSPATRLAQSSLSSLQGSTPRPLAIVATLSIDTLRSDRSTPLRYPTDVRRGDAMYLTFPACFALIRPLDCCTKIG